MMMHLAGRLLNPWCHLETTKQLLSKVRFVTQSLVSAILRRWRCFLRSNMPNEIQFSFPLSPMTIKRPGIRKPGLVKVVSASKE